ncbi:cellulose biosynthesis protein BcsG [Limnobacter humi]|uniref:Cellulose biosynthesis protein BcsG n=1 Tax=Limnobacter humi TaxID=1778671 RepID=A0ABT1WD25_9BURK|nr:cellulose biosynthesis protein BcsG [Limnobacter humi]MCQ8895422.1 cellulose biosynthesis protein BcsG [Limnobacter humi]
MLPWNLYFLIKLGLHLGSVLQLEGWLNLALFAALVLTNPLKRFAGRWMGLLRDILFAGPAIALLLHELGLVVSWALLDQIRQLFGFSVGYLWELVRRSIAPWMLWGALGAYLAVRVLDRYIRTSTWVFCGLIAISAHQVLWLGNDGDDGTDGSQTVKAGSWLARENLSPAELLALGQLDYQRLKVARHEERIAKMRDSTNNADGPDAILNGFFERQKALLPGALSATPVPPDFDLVFLQICSLSWADMQVARQTQHPALRNADFIFENFNSATSYSGPAAIRLLRGRCGQPRHDALYQPTEDSCYLFGQLRNAGFSIEVGFNHNALFENFSKVVLNNLGSQADQPVPYNSVPTGVVAFDGSSVGRDVDYLRTWWMKRQESGKPAVALYYNTITLHDGNRIPGNDQNSLATYPLRLERLLNDIQSMVGDIRKSGRKALVMVVPEHGAGLSGEYGQLVGLRELPTPAITKVPVFGYWVAPKTGGDIPQKTADPTAPRGPALVRQPSSYTALSELLNRWVNATPEQRQNPNWGLLTADLPTTRLVSQQGNITVMESKDSYWLKAPGVEWRTLGPVNRLTP